MSKVANNPISFNGIEFVERKFGPSGPTSLPFFPFVFAEFFYSLSVTANYQPFC
jgi:hypothetical protein